MAINKTDKSFKILINKKFTTDKRNFYQEVGADTINIHVREVWATTIPQDSSSAVSTGIAKYYDKFILTPDPTFPNNAYYFISGSGFEPGTSSLSPSDLVDPNSQSLFQTDFISDKYGNGYEVKLYDNDGNQIFKADSINWIFDYKTGILHIADPGSYSTPYKISVFKYNGQFLDDVINNISGSNEGMWTGSWGSSGNDINRESNVYITGSLYVSGTGSFSYIDLGTFS